MSSPLSSPIGGGDVAKLRDLRGHLLIVKPTEWRGQIPTQNGPADVISVDLVCLTDIDPATGGPRTYNGAQWFGKFIVGGLKAQIGELVLARVATGIARPGNEDKPPHHLETAMNDPAAVACAEAWLAANPWFKAAERPSAQAMAAPVAATPPAPAPIPIPAPLPVAQPAPIPPLPASVPLPVPQPAPVPMPAAPLPLPTPAAPAPVPVAAAATPATAPAFAVPVPGQPQQWTPETLALMAHMQQTGQLPLNGSPAAG